MYLIKYSKVLIIGSGISGYTSNIYLSRANLNPVLVSGNKFNGQLINTKIENWPGFIIIDGLNLMKNILNQLNFIRTEIIFDSIYCVNFLKKPLFFFGLIFIYLSDLTIVATGLKPKFLFLKNEKKYFNKNISFCSVCDGNFYKNKVIAVVGGGNLAFENSIYLSSLVSKIFLIHRNIYFKAELTLILNVFKKKNIFYRFNFFIYDLIGDFFNIKYLKLKNIINNNINIIKIDGLFISIGNKANSCLFLGQLLLNNNEYIITYNYNNSTNINAVFACGDIQNFFYKQAIISSGFGASSALDLISYYNILNY